MLPKADHEYVMPAGVWYCTKCNTMCRGNCGHD